MDKRNNGRNFEKLVAVIQEAYKDLPQTEIYSPYLIKDRDGDEREFDVFVITKVNNFTFQIAIECKDYNRPVSVEKIEAFHSKCSTINNISKKIIFSPNGFQKSAKKNAKKFDIDLYTLTDIEKSKVLSWIDVNNIRRVLLDYKILDCSIAIKNDIFGEIIFDNYIFNDFTKLETQGIIFKNIATFIIYELDRGVKGEMLLPIFEEAKRNAIKDFERGFTMIQTFDMVPLSSYPVYFISSGKTYPITCISMKLKIDIEPTMSNDVEVKAYSDELGNQRGELVSIKFGEGDIVNYYRLKDENTKKVVLIKDNKITTMDLALEVNEKTGQILTINNKHPSEF